MSLAALPAFPKKRRGQGRNLKLEIEYDGTRYCGWQVQAPQKKKSIQEVLSKTLRKILRETVCIHASGRTDAGVHARAQVVNFETHSRIPKDKLRLALNSLLPDDISVAIVEEAPSDFHSRFDAQSKIYRYTILNRPYPSALLNQRVFFFPYHIDTARMRKEARCLIGTHDFKSFQAADKKERTSTRTIKKIMLSREGDCIHIDIEANGFLYNMVRNIAGTLLEAGRGRFPVGSVKQILQAKDRKFAGPTLPAKGLCLLKVKY